MQNQQDELGYQHFVLIYIDRDGHVRHEASQSIVNSREMILPRVTDAFLRAVARSNKTVPSHSPPKPGAPTTLPSRRPSSGQIPNRPDLFRAPYSVEAPRAGRHNIVPRAPGHSIQPAACPQHQADQQELWPLWSRQVTPQQYWQNPWNEEVRMRSSQKALISIRDKDFLRRYYEKVFENLQQINCRILAKAYVKLVEPRKQVNYPYNGRKVVAGRTRQLEPDATKPPWWPSGVSHREPDHLPKAERIRLLVHILCELHTGHRITARRLKEADQPIRCQISPAERLEILDEVYHVREEEEKFLEGVTDGKSMLLIARANLPVAVESPISQGGSRKITPGEGTSSHEREQPTEIMAIRSGPIRSTNTLESAFTTGDLPPNLSTTIPRPPSHIPNLYINQDLPIHPGFDFGASSSRLQQNLKQKHQCGETGPSIGTSPNTLWYYSPIFAGSQPFVPEPYGELQNFQHQGVPTTGQPVTELYGEPMEPSHAFPYYFDIPSLSSPYSHIDPHP
ncbi:hypothetical protein N7474_005020 [Penicillium riverlandense]|uniref:uncharacterized protein n=1 Tax=Penicillium riverlandense TaxID=1903569 RepID=UPI002548E909|nr:uncharacterized protein N7474_005020 [Penicillium riverlandense]KAJ5819429.1 hypothetical protein N7474_005020 [Penicillium riverlandense]